MSVDRVHVRVLSLPEASQMLLPALGSAFWLIVMLGVELQPILRSSGQKVQFSFMFFQFNELNFSNSRKTLK